MFLWAIRPSKFDFKEVIVQYGELGEMGISLNTIEDLVVRAANQVNGVKEVKPRIKISQDSTSIILNVIILPDNNIPELMQNLQQTVNKYILETAGLKVSDVKIHIKSIYGSKTRRVE
ncbi:alkaline shock response membrane anchor protein AmaP [Caldisericum sp. AR60]|uniref:alkaline shock response membrane anchor protein AmaP n=2 Tax=unclassified Caldisericum TaxID=2641600 RepID=UPI0039FCF715